ncbi:MAG TPA: hypothetical protein VMV86_05185 [Methanosarcinales archaeon]|nr:hypothetical protein [Methanosarcinales archaeon]
MSDGLTNFEAEAKVLGFFFNSAIPVDQKTSILGVLYKDHFSYEAYRAIFGLIKVYEIYDKIILWDKVSHIGILPFEVIDLKDIDEFVTYEEAKSYMEILLDKFQKRALYNFGNEIRDAMLRGDSQFELALRAQEVLGSIASSGKLETNQDLLDKVLNEQPGDTLSTGYRALDKLFGGYTRGMVVTIAGDSGHLKTTFALDSAFRMA